MDGSAMTDEDTLQKAMRRKGALNLDTVGMSSSTKSFLSFSTPVVHSKLNSVGIKLGRDLHEINVSTNILKHMEYDR
jgi:hypothetical protein